LKFENGQTLFHLKSSMVPLALVSWKEHSNFILLGNTTISQYVSYTKYEDTGTTKTFCLDKIEW
jgi:hypothetical protein